MRSLKKKTLSMLLIASFVMAAAAGCGQDDKSGAQEKTDNGTNVSQEEKTEEAADTQEAPETEEEKLYDTEMFKISSSDLHEGVWDTVITDTDNGSNVSPQLSWEPVEGAEGYVIYMTDINAGNWMHWKSGFVTETELAQGAAEKDEYIGPYPPSGTHEYEIRVFALKKPVEAVRGAFDDTNTLLKSVAKKLDTDVDSNTGNIIACGYISGTYTAGE